MSRHSSRRIDKTHLPHGERPEQLHKGDYPTRETSCSAKIDDKRDNNHGQAIIDIGS